MWFKIKSFKTYFNPNENVKKAAREYLTNDLELSENLAKLLMKNSIEKNWPEELKKASGEKKKEMISQLKGE